MKGIIFRVLAVIFSIICFLSFLEVLLRLDLVQLGSFYPVGGFHEINEVVGWRLKPNLRVRFKGREWNAMIQTNSHGFRDSREYSFEKPDGQKRILVLGDSFVWGWGVENDEMFTKIIEKELEGVEVINAGHTGFDSLQEFLLYRDVGIRYKPDLVLLCFYYNDINDLAATPPDELKPSVSIENGQLKLLRKLGLHDPVDIVWWQAKQYSKALAYMEYLGSLISHTSKEIRLRKARQSAAGKDAGKQAENGQAQPYDYPEEYRIPQSKEFDNAWHIVRYVVTTINDMQRRIGGTLKVAMFPEKRLVGAAPDVLNHPQASGNLMLLHDKMREICDPQGIEIIDLLPHFRKEPNPLGFYFHGDSHWTPDGHRLAAKILLQKLGGKAE